jgi:enterochelin esterase-like enzyme
VWLPNDYDTSGKRYRTVYYLSGWEDSVESVITYLGQTTAPHSGDPFVIVAVDGINALGGSFYRNSPIGGNWEDAIAKDLVAHVDAKYRTVPKATSRGITGHSMGGYGALQIAFDHSDVFSAVDALSPGAVSDKGMKTTQIFASDNTIQTTLTTLGKIKSLKNMTARIDFLKEYQTTGDEDAVFGLAYGAAVAPDLSLPTLIRFPYKEVKGKLVEDRAIMAAWNNGFGNWPAKIEQHKADLAKLRGLRLEYGKGDEYTWIPEGSRYLDGALTEAKITHETVEFDGTHESRDRLPGSVLPYLSKVLATE